MFLYECMYLSYTHTFIEFCIHLFQKHWTCCCFWRPVLYYFALLKTYTHTHIGTSEFTYTTIIDSMYTYKILTLNRCHCLLFVYDLLIDVWAERVYDVLLPHDGERGTVYISMYGTQIILLYNNANSIDLLLLI